MSTMARATVRPLVVANWKLHGSNAFITKLVGALKQNLAEFKDIDIVVCPPFVYLSQVCSLLRGSNIALGAQHMSDQEQGAYTGEVSALMLKDVGCEYVIIGHSERRYLYHEDNELIARKLEVAFMEGLTPILCLGETLKQRESSEASDVVAEQLAAVVDKVPDGAQWVLAYEPVWAIGTGHTASIEQILEMHAMIRTQLARLQISESARVVYGGSIKQDNAPLLFEADGVDGGLVGGASLDGEVFYRICVAADKYNNV